MANLFKEFQTGKAPNYTPTGIFAISGEITKVFDEDLVRVAVKVYSKEKQSVINESHTVNLSVIGGTEGIKVGDKLTAMCERNEDGDLEAKVADIGNTFLTYKGYGIAAGETYYKSMLNTKTNVPYIQASIRVKDNNTETMVKNNLSIKGYQDTKPQDRARKTLEVRAGINKLETKQYCDYPFEGQPFDSALTFKENPKVNAAGKRYDAVQEFTPTEGKNAGKTYYSRNLFAQTPTSENIGTPMMDLIKERAERAEQYNKDHATEPVNTETKAETPAPEQDEFPLEEDGINYNE